MNREPVTLDKARVSYGVIHALQGFSGSFLPGQVTALTGGDGAGKSTLLKLLAGRAPLQSGSVHGLPDKKDIGYQPADSGVWRDMSVIENMRFIASAYRMDSSLARNRIEGLLADAGLTYARDTTGRNLSGGMRQKLGFIMAALHEPDLLLLDEPTTGVDPASREGIWTLISAQAADGKTVVFATTYLDEAERCASLYLMNDGKVLAQGRAEDICAKAPGRLWQAPASVGKQMTRDSFFGSSLQDRPAPSAFHNWRRADTALAWTAAGDERTPEGFTRTGFDLENASIAYLLQDDQGGLPIKPPGRGTECGHRQSPPARRGTWRTWWKRSRKHHGSGTDPGHGRSQAVRILHSPERCLPPSQARSDHRSDRWEWCGQNHAHAHSPGAGTGQPGIHPPAWRAPFLGITQTNRLRSPRHGALPHPHGMAERTVHS
ncbi:ABC transporter ATP-binding protein [Bifidobacterium sp. B4081]|nr:ABC transporter ATP-binding protein [Bifidobacterium sp. B4077]MCX8646633.1 ABC transporter ATP-binding protein [Bifidobacterium sp. B4081]MCX8668038.1 ABC transporter ATP-binding protein [Bifidobacterium sp. B3998]